jgi:hypothetical protein
MGCAHKIHHVDITNEFGFALSKIRAAQSMIAEIEINQIVHISLSDALSCSTRIGQLVTSEGGAINQRS